MFGMSKSPSYREAGAAAEVESSGREGVSSAGRTQTGYYHGRGRQLTCPPPIWAWLFPGSPPYKSAPETAAGDEPIVITEELQLDDALVPCAEKEQGPRLVESNGPVTVVIRRSE